MPDPRDFLPQPPWEGPPVPRGVVRKLQPTTLFEKRYAQKFEYRDREIWHFPHRRHRYAIPREVRISPGIEPDFDKLATYSEIWKLTKGPVGYSSVDDFVVLSGYDPGTVYQHLTWLVKNEQATMNVDRMGNVVYIKLRR